MPKKIYVITIQQNQVLEIPNDNIEIEVQKDIEESQVIVDNTQKQESPLDIVEVVESQDVKQDLPETIVKVKKPRVNQKKYYPSQLLKNQLKLTYRSLPSLM